MKVTEAAFVGYPVTDIKRAREFYEGVLGLTTGEFDQEIESMPGKYWIEYELSNVTLAISNTWEPGSEGGPSVALEVEDLSAAMTKLKEAGANIIVEHMESPVCEFALITDPDGNGITIHKRKEGCQH
ncbi:MAG: VOC family protein [Verrucomicrobiota bacterium]